MIRPGEFIRLLRHSQTGRETPGAFALGTIPATYVGGGARPTVIHDGEIVPSTKAYTYLTPYVPAANDKVLLGRVGHTWVVLGKVT